MQIISKHYVKNLVPVGRICNSKMKLSVNGMNLLYLNIFFIRVMLFFNLKTNQQFILGVFLSAAFLASCSSTKKVAFSKRKSPERVVELSDETMNDFPVIEKPVEPLRDRDIDKPKAEEENKADKVISKARTFIGTPYKYGGTTRSGMDCSALLINSFSAVKVNLPRSSEAQSKVGTEIKMNELKPGDLVFFATGNKKKEITHVGLVTDVKSKDNIKFIHASSSLGVVETNLFAEYYQKRFRVARRVIE
jgi:cell wall-associated NlpC family hydrolase